MKNCMKPLSRPGPRRRRPQPVSPILTGSASVSRPRRRRTSGTRRCQRGRWPGGMLPPGLPPGGPADAGPPLRRGRGAGDKNALPSPVIGTRAFQTLRGATQIQACGHAPLTLCCGRGTAPVSGPAAGAVFSGAVSVRSFQPRGLSLSGGVPDTHAPSWRWTLSAARAGAGRGNGENVSLRWRRGCGWGSSPRASPSLPGPDRGSAAQRWPRWWPWGRSAGHTAWRWTARCRPALRSGGR